MIYNNNEWIISYGSVGWPSSLLCLAWASALKQKISWDRNISSGLIYRSDSSCCLLNPLILTTWPLILQETRPGLFSDSKGIPQWKCRIYSSLSLNSAAKTSHKVALDSGSEERDAISSWIELQQCSHVLFNLLQYISRILIIIASALWNEHYYSRVEYKLTSLKRNHIYRYKQEFWNQTSLVRIQAPSILTQDNCMTLIDQFPIAV